MSPTLECFVIHSLDILARNGPGIFASGERIRWYTIHVKGRRSMIQIVFVAVLPREKL
jgi:hypothetical protein